MGDGQVSGLSPNQFVFKFYEELMLQYKEALKNDERSGPLNMLHCNMDSRKVFILI